MDGVNVMPAKLHVSGGIKSAKVSDRHRVIGENMKFQLTVNMTDGNKIYLYTDHYGLIKIKRAIDQWWEDLK